MTHDHENHVTVKKKALVAALKNASKLIKRKHREILQCVRLSMDKGNTLLMDATDLENYLTETIPAKGSMEPTCINANALMQIVRSQKGDEIELIRNADKVQVKAGAFQSEIPVFDVSEYPGSPDLTWRTIADIEACALTTGMKMTAPFAARGVNRYALSGIHIGATRGQGIEFSASDTHQLSLVSLPVVARKNLDVIIPVPGAALLQKLALRKTVRMSVPSGKDPATARFQGQDWTLFTRLIDGTFPRYRDVIPAERSLPGRLVVNRASFLEDLKQILPTANPETRSVSICRSTGKNVILKTESASVEVKALKHRGLPFYTVCGAYLMDALKLCDQDEVTIRLGDPDGPMKIEQGSWTYVLMPIRGSQTHCRTCGQECSMLRHHEAEEQATPWREHYCSLECQQVLEGEWAHLGKAA